MLLLELYQLSCVGAPVARVPGVSPAPILMFFLGPRRVALTRHLCAQLYTLGVDG